MVVMMMLMLMLMIMNTVRGKYPGDIATIPLVQSLLGKTI